MGACVSSRYSISNENNLELTKTDIHLIRESWKIVVKAGLGVYGTNMMTRVFLEHKQLKPLWRFSKGLETADQMSANLLLKMHGEKLFNAIDLAINSLNDLSTLVPILIQLGYSHYTFGVRDEHFPVGLKLIFFE